MSALLGRVVNEVSGGFEGRRPGTKSCGGFFFCWFPDAATFQRPAHEILGLFRRLKMGTE